MAVLEALPGYNGARDEANITMLLRLVAGHQRSTEPGAAADRAGGE
jgi:hypothetical protein